MHLAAATDTGLEERKVKWLSSILLTSSMILLKYFYAVYGLNIWLDLTTNISSADLSPAARVSVDLMIVTGAEAIIRNAEASGAASLQEVETVSRFLLAISCHHFYIYTFVTLLLRCGNLEHCTGSKI